ncbi:MAG TPA: hypothetical protein VGF89_06920 [Steroidobacteraceae bacterium]
MSWSASSDSGGPGVGGYHVYRNSALVASVATASYTDTPLVASTTYHYQVAAFDRAATPRVSAQSSVLTVTTAADTQPPSVPGGLGAAAISATGLTLSWSASTDQPVPGASGVGGYYVNRNGVRVATVTSGTSFSDSGLVSGSSYSYQVAAFDKAAAPNVSALSAALAVTTVHDTSAPTVPAGLAATTIATGSVSLSWSASADLPNPGGTGVGGYYLYRNGARVATVTAGTSYQDKPLTASTPYSYQVAAFDNAATPNISALSAMLNVTTLADTQAPTVPSGLNASGVSGTGLTLGWGASTDLPNPGAVGVGGYYVYRGGVRIASVTNGTSFTDSGLTASTSYSYQVAAFDKVTPTPNVSALSAAFAASTAGDTQPPTVPAGLAASNVSVAGVTLSWGVSTDLPNPGGTGVGGYYVYRNGTRVGTVATASFTDGNLTASTTYNYQVAAFDKASTPNVSALSGALPVTTLPDTQPPTVPTGLTATNVGLSSATLSWNASSDLPNPGATGVGGYIVYRGGVSLTTTSATGYTDNGLTPGTNYSYQVAAFDKATPANTSSMSAAYALTTKSNMTVTPANAALTESQTQQFTTNAAGGTSLNWYVDGVQGGSTALGTISSSGLYTPPSTPGTHTVKAASSSNPSASGTAAVAVTNLHGLTTYQYDLARTGQNLQEYALTPASLLSGSFGKLWSCALDGIVYAQPLYMANLPIGGGTHNVLFVATMHDSVYAFDADSGSCQPLWKTSFISTGVTTTPTTCGDTPTEYGITGTPVIDPVSQTLYLVASTNESTGTVQRVHALNILNGSDRVAAPAITAQVPGNGDGGITVSFNALQENQRPGLALTNGNVYISWASHCDTSSASWHGWLMSYSASTLAQTGKLNITPNGSWGGIWMSAAAPAVDSTGTNLYLSTGNGAFNNTASALPALTPNNNFGESFLNVDPTNLEVQDFYTPSQYAAWTSADLDISSGAVTILPDNTGPAGHPNVLVGTDKQGHLWMIDRNHMTGYVPGMDKTVQYLSLPHATVYAIHSALGYWNGTLYISVGGGPLMAFQLTAAGLVPSTGSGSPATAVAASQTQQTYSFPNPTPSISASPTGNAIVWVLDNHANGAGGSSAPLGPAILRAYDATNLATMLYSSSTRSADTAGNASKFIVPVVANGHVYVVGHDALTVYGLSP